jgi:hypothetical protein
VPQSVLGWLLRRCLCGVGLPESYTGGAQPYPVHSYEFSEKFICKCKRVK